MFGNIFMERKKLQNYCLVMYHESEVVRLFYGTKAWKGRMLKSCVRDCADGSRVVYVIDDRK